MDKVYSVKICFAKEDFVASFDAMELNNSTEKVRHYSRLDVTGVCDSIHGSLTMDFNKNKFLFSYDVFEISGKITAKKIEADNSILANCVTDFGAISIEIIFTEEWG